MKTSGATTPSAPTGRAIQTVASAPVAPHLSGFTLIELVIALGLLAGLMLVVFQLFDRSLSLWRIGETKRATLEQASVVANLMTRDLRGIESGARGDLVAEWVRFDTDGDGIAESKWPRFRLVREASAADVARIQRDARLAVDTKSTGSDAASSNAEKLDRASPGLVEAVWMIAPASLVDPDARSEGILWRGERLVADTTTKSFFASDFFGSSNRPPAGATDEVGGGCLWMQVLFAAPKSIVHDGWKLGGDASAAYASWDAWAKGRPDASIHPWNERSTDLPAVHDRPLLPRRVRIELEFERPIDRTHRTRLLEPVDNVEGVLRVDDEKRIPSEGDSYVLLDAEWMKVVSIERGRVAVERGQRGTTPTGHAKNALIHWGLRFVTETPVATYREEWGK